MYKALRLTRSVSRLCEQIFTKQKFKSDYNNFATCSALFLNRNHSVLRQGIKNYCSGNTNHSDAEKIQGLNENIDVQELTNNDPEVEKKLRLIILEADVMRQDGSKVPELSSIKLQQWKELLHKSTRSQRKRYLEFLWKTEKKRENTKAKKEQARVERENRPEYVGDGHLRYGLNHNTIFIRIYDSTVNNMYNAKLISAAQFGQPLVIDCGYDAHMTARECANCAKQIMMGFSDNRIHDEPFDLHLCNADLSKPTLTTLGRHIATLHEPWFPLHIHPTSYFDTKFHTVPGDIRDRLVYLTPHCREELREFDHEAVYIIGGIVDKINHEPVSLAKAKREKIRMAKLPLDKYLQWGGGSGKSLTVNHMVAILLDVRRTGDWAYALRHVPRRKLAWEDAPVKKVFNRRAPVKGRSLFVDDEEKNFDPRSYDNRRNKNNSKTSKDFITELLRS